jgi:hypothetical protein
MLGGRLPEVGGASASEVTAGMTCGGVGYK